MKILRDDSGKGIAAIVGTACLWSLNGPLIKLLHEGGQGIDGIAIAFYRSLIGGLFFLPAAWRHRASLTRVGWGWRIASVSVFTLMTISFVVATTWTTASNAIVLQYTAPVWTFLLSPWILGVRPRLSEGVMLLLSMAGVAIIYGGSSASDSRGLSVALVSGFGYGTLIVLLRRLRAVHPYGVVTMNCLGSGILLAPAVGMGSSFAMTSRQFFLILVLGVFQFGLAYALFSWGIQRVEAHRASLISLVETILNPLGTFFLVGERVPRPTWIGGPLILAGAVGWILLQRKNESSPEGNDHFLRRASKCGG